MKTCLEIDILQIMIILGLNSIYHDHMTMIFKN